MDNKNKYFGILTHTCPYELRPTEWFLSGYDDSTIDNSMEHFLSKVYNLVEFNHWYCGHFHGSKVIKLSDDKTFYFMFENILIL